MNALSKRRGAAATALFVLLALCCMVSVMSGPVFIHPLTVVKTFLNLIMPGTGPFDVGSADQVIVLTIRMPRVCMSALCGAGLALCGAAMQGLFRNPMAEPYVLGMSSGAGAGAAMAIALGAGSFFGGAAVPMCAFCGAALTIFLVYSLARTDGRVPAETLLLAGIAVGFFLHAVVSFIKLCSTDEALRDIVLWLMGSFTGTTWKNVALVSPLIFAGGVVIIALASEINALQFGEESAMHLGVEVESVKRILLASTALITAACVAAGGILGFVGLGGPHVVRLLCGGNHRSLLGLSALAGGVFLVCADTVARSAGGVMEIPVGIVTAAIGAPWFVYLLRRRKKAVSWW